MLSKFLADCDGYSLHSSHIYRQHFQDISPTASYFTIRWSKLLLRIHETLNNDESAVYFRREGPSKLMVWLLFDKPIGLYRKGNYFTRCCCIVITKNNNWATVKTAYPDYE